MKIMEYRTKSNNKVAFFLYFKPDIQYKLEMNNNGIVYFVFDREDVEDMILDFNDMMNDKISSYVDLGLWLSLQASIRTLIKNYKDKKADDRDGIK